ncbi:MAG: restriction endonuclease subunit S [Pseudomonadota bacterium]
MSTPAYAEYQESGIAWVGKIPVGWSIKPFYSLASERNESNKGMLKDNLLSLSYGRVVRKDIESNDGLLPESFETYQIVRAGDIIFRLTDLQNDKRSLRTATVQEDGIITSAYLAAVPRAIESRYLGYLLRSYDTTKVFYSMGGGLRQSMKFSDIKRLPTLVPPLEEQIAIAAFLDLETVKIDALISEQEKLITLLAEKRQATISRAVTKGLNPNAPMEDSGVEWLGDIPRLWTTARVKQISTFITSGPRGWSDYIDERGDDIFLQSGDLNYELEILPHQAKRVVPPQGAEGVRTRLDIGDVVVCITGANTGRVAVVDSLPATTYINQHLSLIRPIKSKVNPNYLALVLASNICQTYFEVRQYGLKEGLSLKNVADAPLPLPDIAEQSAIVSYVREETSKLMSLDAVARQGIALLKERRSALLSAAVTGKIDVRQAVPQEQLPIQEAA